MTRTTDGCHELPREMRIDAAHRTWEAQDRLWDAETAEPRAPYQDVHPRDPLVTLPQPTKALQEWVYNTFVYRAKLDAAMQVDKRGTA
jgi:hypothetical protein